MAQKTCFILLILLLTAHTNLLGQIIPPDTGESEIPDVRIGSQYTLLPLLGYSSDLGLYGGALFQRINYGNDVRPFLSNLTTDFTVSTKGNLIFDLNYERTKTIGTDVRSMIEFIGQRFRQDYYFGIGNQTEFTQDLFNDKFFFFENREFSLYYQARKEISRFGKFGQFDLTASTDISYLNSISRGENTKFAEDVPVGFGKSWSNKIGFGFIADSRENEFAPTRGLRYEVSLEISSPITGSDYTFTDIRVDLRHFKTLFRNVVLAQKLDIASIEGDAPFWDLAIIGGEEGLRGYHLDRFRGNHSITHLLELRTWIFDFWNDEIRVGNQLFWDTGRVYSQFDSNEIFNNWKHSFGGGLIFSLFNPDLLLRMDVGFSDETYRLHFGAGYIF